MIIWKIYFDNIDIDIEMGAVTVLKGSHKKWFQLIRLIEDFFCNKNSTVSILEDTQDVRKKDWECYFIPFDSQIQLDKFSAKSPLKFLLDEFVEVLSNSSTLLSEINDLWVELAEEIEFISEQEKFSKYTLKLSLKDLSLDEIKKFIKFEPLNKWMTPFEYKKLLLNLIIDKSVERKRLIIIEFPELYTSKREMDLFCDIINRLVKKGVHFLIVTNHSLSGNLNYIYKGKIINNAELEKIKRKVINEIPYFFDDSMYMVAKKHLLRLVDNIEDDEREIKLSTDLESSISIAIYIMLKHLGIDSTVDTSSIPKNLSAFINSYTPMK